MQRRWVTTMRARLVHDNGQGQDVQTHRFLAENLVTEALFVCFVTLQYEQWQHCTRCMCLLASILHRTTRNSRNLPRTSTMERYQCVLRRFQRMMKCPGTCIREAGVGRRRKRVLHAWKVCWSYVSTYLSSRLSPRAPST
jgi:hypothetical protein